MDISHLSIHLMLEDGKDIPKLRVWVSRFFDIITYGFHLRACDITLWASILPQELFLTQLLKNEHSSLSIYRFEKHVSKRNFWWKSQKCGHFLSSSTHDKEIADQCSPSSSNAQRITFFSDIDLIWFKSVRRTFCRQFQKSPYLVPISSHSWDMLKSNFSALYLKDNQNGPSQATLQTKISHFIFKEQKKFSIYPKPFRSYRALESAILSWDTLYFDKVFEGQIDWGLQTGMISLVIDEGYFISWVDSIEAIFTRRNHDRVVECLDARLRWLTMGALPLNIQGVPT